MKGIILAGGSGTRLYPITKAISKQSIPIYDKPMIYYPLSVLMMIGIKSILIISTPRDIKVFNELLSDGTDLGIDISYAIQEVPRGIAEALIIGESFIGEDSVALILGDNVFYGEKLEEILLDAKENNEGATVFAYYVNNPSDFGIVEFDKNNKVISIEEKPRNAKSNFAVPGLYFYNNYVLNIVKSIKPSKRNELEITSVNEAYLSNGTLTAKVLSKGIVWLDTGTYKSLIRASNFVENIQNNQGIYIGCIEEIAYKKRFISVEEFRDLAMVKSYGEYQSYLLRCIVDE